MHTLIAKLSRIGGASLLVVFGLTGCGDQQAATPALYADSVASQRANNVPALGNGVSSVGLLVEPDDGKRQLTKPIRAATRQIDLTMYLLTDHTLIHDLEYANAKGVRVRVILEPHPFGGGANGSDANQSAYDQLYAANIAVRWSSSRFKLTHQKTMIIDGATAFVLTTNYTYSAFPNII